jgi:hypothetical protein
MRILFLCSCSSQALAFIPTHQQQQYQQHQQIQKVHGNIGTTRTVVTATTTTTSNTLLELYKATHEHSNDHSLPRTPFLLRRRNHTLPTSASPSTSTVALQQAINSEDIKAQKKKGTTRKKRSTIAERKKGPGSSSVTAPATSTNIHNTEEPTSKELLVNDPNADMPLPSSMGMARLSRAVAKASAERSLSSSASPTYTGRADTRNAHSTSEPKSLSQLTRVIDSQLYKNGPRGTIRGDYPKIDGLVQNARDNMISLLGFNQVKGDWKMHSSTSTFNVAIVFGKKLVRDQVTVEYASRIRTLARLFKDEPEFRPSLVCFSGGISEGSHVANSDAGYIFFRHMCEAQGIDLEGVSICIDNKSESDVDAVKYVTQQLKKKYAPKWLEESPETTSLMQKAINVHFTLVSTEYHLCNINDVHHRSPEKSLLMGMETMGEAFQEQRPMYGSNNSFGSVSSSSSTRTRMLRYDEMEEEEAVEPIRGLVKTSWSFQYATYPYIYAKNDAVVFLGKCYLLGEELMPLLVNMKGVVDQKEFFQRDNYLMLASIRRSLVEEIEALHKPSLSRKKTLNNELRRIKDVYGNERNVITILEGALLSLGRCVDLVKPAGLHVGSVSKEDWKKALKALEHSMSEIRTFCDPDRPLLPSEWGKLVDDDSDSMRNY